MNLSFYRWLKKQTRRNDSIGDIARDIGEDHCRPKSGRKIAILNHLRYDHQAGELALKAFERAYREWEAETANQRGRNSEAREPGLRVWNEV